MIDDDKGGKSLFAVPHNMYRNVGCGHIEYRVLTSCGIVRDGAGNTGEKDTEIEEIDERWDTDDETDEEGPVKKKSKRKKKLRTVSTATATATAPPSTITEEQKVQKSKLESNTNTNTNTNTSTGIMV